MKLAEALQERADLNRRIAQMTGRLCNNAVVQEGEEPAENPQDLLEELNICIAELKNLIARINLTNSKTVIEGKTLTEWIAQKDCLSLKLEAYQDLVREASRLAQRATKTEIKIMSTVDVKEMQKLTDALAKELRLTDNKIQETNWKTELQ